MFKRKAPAESKRVAKRATTPPPPPKRTRRGPLEILEELKERRAAVQEQYDKKLTRLDERIASLETRHRDVLALQEIRAGKTPEELQEELESLKAQERLLRKALKSR